MPNRSDCVMDAVAAVILECGLTPAEALEMNNGTGWTVDLPAEGTEPVYPGTWERVSELQLSNADLMKAIWRANAQRR